VDTTEGSVMRIAVALVAGLLSLGVRVE